MKRLLISLVLVVAPFQAHALLISTSAGNFDVSTISGSFDDLSGTLMRQVWWDNETLSLEFAEEVNTQLGLPGGGDFGPLFAYDDSVAGSAWCLAPLCGGSDGAVRFTVSPTGTRVWAVARSASVPEPSTLALLGAGLLGFGIMRRRRAA